MDRKKRIRVVVVAVIGLVAQFMASAGVPLIAIAFVPVFDPSDDVHSFLQTGSEIQRTVNAATIGSLISSLVAGGCFVYLFVVLAAWFIGAPNATRNDKA